MPTMNPAKRILIIVASTSAVTDVLVGKGDKIMFARKKMSRICPSIASIVKRLSVQPVPPCVTVMFSPAA